MRSLGATAMIAVSVSVLAGAWSSASAQRYSPIGGEGPVLDVEVTKPFVSADGPFAGASFASSGWDATVTYPLGSGPTLFARMGLMYAAIEGLDGSLALANPRIGVLMGSASGGRRAEVHVDLPAATDFGDNYASGIGIFSNFEERERFLADTWGVGATGSARIEPGPGAFLGARLGGRVLVPDEGDTDVYATVSVYGDAPTDETRFRIEFSSLYLVSGEGIDFSDRSTFFGSLDITWPSARLSPTLFVRVPIDNTLDATVPIVAGARVRIGG
jgi:hypothetical protein